MAAAGKFPDWQLIFASNLIVVGSVAGEGQHNSACVGKPLAASPALLALTRNPVAPAYWLTHLYAATRSTEVTQVIVLLILPGGDQRMLPELAMSLAESNVFQAFSAAQLRQNCVR